jgi:hypothetical protein
MDIYESGWIWAESGDETVVPGTLTVSNIPPNTNLFVTISISSFTQAVNFQTGVAGMVASGVRRWDVFNPDGSVQTVDPGPNQMQNNSMFIPNCASVTFELSVQLAEAWAEINLFQY